MAEKDPPPEYTEGEPSPAAAASDSHQASPSAKQHATNAPHLQTAQTLEGLATTLSTMASAMRAAPTPAAAQPFTHAAVAALSAALSLLNGDPSQPMARGPLPSEPSPTVIGLRDAFRPPAPTTLRISAVGSQQRIHVDSGGSPGVAQGRIMASVIRTTACRADLGFYSPSSEVLLLLKAAAGGRAQLVEPRGRGPVGSLVRTDDSSDPEEPFGMRVSVRNAFAVKGGAWPQDEVLVVEAKKGVKGDLVEGAVWSRGGAVCMLFYTTLCGEYTIRVGEGFDLVLAGAIAVAAAQHQTILGETKGETSKAKGKARAP